MKNDILDLVNESRLFYANAKSNSRKALIEALKLWAEQKNDTTVRLKRSVYAFDKIDWCSTEITGFDFDESYDLDYVFALCGEDDIKRSLDVLTCDLNTIVENILDELY